MKKVMIAIPTLNTVHIKFVGSLVSLLFHQIENVEFRLQFVQDSMTYTARNHLAEQAMKEECDYVLWIDSDMTFPADAMERLLTHDKDMVTALYFQRRGKHLPVIYKENYDESYANYPKDKLFQVKACGFGMVLMRTEVLRKTLEANDGCLFHPFPSMGEDLSFCHRWTQTGGEIWCDSSVKCGHVGEYEYTEADYETNGV